MNSQDSLDKQLVTGSEGISALPGFPVVIGCIDKNLITIAAVSMVSFQEPALMMIGIVPSRYSYELIKEVKDYTINVPTTDQFDAMLYCGRVSGRDEKDKFKGAGLTAVKATKIRSYLVKECPVNMECKVVHTLDLGGTHTWFVGEVVAAHVAKNYNRSQAFFFWPGEFRYVGDVITK